MYVIEENAMNVENDVDVRLGWFLNAATRAINRVRWVKILAGQDEVRHDKILNGPVRLKAY